MENYAPIGLKLMKNSNEFNHTAKVAICHRNYYWHCCYMKKMHNRRFFNCWLVVLRINVDLAIFQPYLDLEAGDNQSLKIQVARPEIEPRSSCSAIQELNHSATAAPFLTEMRINR